MERTIHFYSSGNSFFLFLSREKKKFINSFVKEFKGGTVNALVHLIWRLNEPVDTLMQGVPRVARELPVQ